MMATVKKIVNGISPVTPRFDVEEETVQSILKQCPNKDAKKHHQSYMRKCLAHSNRHRDAPTNNWQPNDRNCPPDCESQELPKITFEKSRAFLAYDWLVNPSLISFSKMTDLEDKGFV